MTTFAILVKSYRPDLAYAERLIDSYSRHNPEGLALHLVVPDPDMEAFAHLVAPTVTLHGESAFASHLVADPLNGYDPGYINQEIVKLAFWETGLADNYLCLDSDAEIVRDLSISDFMADATTPFTFLTEDSDLRSEPGYFSQHWQVREAALRRIQQAIGLDDPRLLTVHGHAVFSAAVLRSFADRFLTPRGWDYRDALAIAPYEPTWYSLWLQKDRTIPIVMREPIVKTFHDPAEYLDYVLRSRTSQDAARGYAAVILNSNFSRGEGLASLDTDGGGAVAAYVPTGEIVKALGLRARRRHLWRGSRSR